MVEVQTTLIVDDPIVPEAGTVVAPKVYYFAVGPSAHEVTCPFCKVQGKTNTKKRWLRWYRQHFCSNCGEYLGTYRRPQL